MEKNKEKKNKDVSLGAILQHPLTLNIYDEILERKVSKLGNSGHISIPSKHIGKKARVLIFKDSKEEENKS